MAWTSGPRVETLARTIVARTRQRTRGHVGIPFVSDGWTPYPETIKAIDREREPSGIRPGWDILRPTPGIRLTQAVKHRKGRRLVRVEVRATIGEAVAQPYAVHLERLNGILRDRLNCLTRKTHGFAKEIETWDGLYSSILFEHTWLHHHLALRVPLPVPQDGRIYHQRTPALAIQLTDHQWSWQEFLLFRVMQC